MTDVINPSTVESPETYLQFGNRYYQSGNIALALKNYERALAINPDLAAVHERIGLVHQQQGNDMEAIASFTKAIQINPQSLEAQLGLGNAYQKMGWAELAITHFQQALELYPDRFLTEYHCKLGDSLKERGKTKEALASYERAIATNPDCIDGYRAIAQIYMRHNDPEAVHTVYERANARNLELLQSKDYNALGVAWMFQVSSLSDTEKSAIDDCVDRAISSFERAIQIEPAHADAHCNLGSAFIRKNQFKDAIIAYKEAIDIDPNFAQPYFNLGILLNNIGKVDEAIACFQSAVDLVPNWVEAKQYLGKLLERQL